MSHYDHAFATTDTLRYWLLAQTVVPHESVRVTVRVQALETAELPGEVPALARIRAALGELVAADWTLARIEREEDASGFERVALTASARVPVEATDNLVVRARRVSRPGVALADPSIEYVLPTDAVDDAVQRLREELLAEALAQAERFTALTGRRWRVGDIEFGAYPGAMLEGSRTGKGAWRGPVLDAGELPEDTVAGGERIRLYATVVLKAAAEHAETPPAQAA